MSSIIDTHVHVRYFKRGSQSLFYSSIQELTKLNYNHIGTNLNNKRKMPARRTSSGGHQNQTHTQFNNVPDDKIYKFTKGEIVWAKMKFFSAWPAKVSQLL